MLPTWDLNGGHPKGVFKKNTHSREWNDWEGRSEQEAFQILRQTNKWSPHCRKPTKFQQHIL